MGKELLKEHGREWVAVVILITLSISSPFIMGLIQNFFQDPLAEKSILWSVANRFIDIGIIALIIWFLVPTFKEFFINSKKDP